MSLADAIALASVVIAIGIGISTIFPRIRADVLKGLRDRIDDLEDKIKNYEENERNNKRNYNALYEEMQRVKAYARNLEEYVKWLQDNSVLKEGVKPPPRLLRQVFVTGDDRFP